MRRFIPINLIKNAPIYQAGWDIFFSFPNCKKADVLLKPLTGRQSKMYQKMKQIRKAVFER